MHLHSPLYASAMDWKSTVMEWFWIRFGCNRSAYHGFDDGAKVCVHETMTTRHKQGFWSIFGSTYGTLGLAILTPDLDSGE